MNLAPANNEPSAGTGGHRITVEFVAARQLEFQIKRVMKNSAPMPKQPAVPPLILFQVGSLLADFIAENPEFATPLGKKILFANFRLHLEKIEAALKINGKGK